MPGDRDGDNELYRMLGEIQGAQKALGRDVAGMREEHRIANTNAEGSRRRLHEDINSLSRRVDLVEKFVEDTSNRITLVQPTVQEHEQMRLRADGVTIALRNVGKVVYVVGSAVLVGIFTLIGTVATYLWHIINSPTPGR
jgi:hypothetical protein